MPRTREPHPSHLGRRLTQMPVRDLERRLDMLRLAVPTWTALHASFERDLEAARAARTQLKA